MPLVSNPEAIRRGRPSLLAIVETISASGLSFWLAWEHYSIKPLVIAGALAPFLLLRTSLSTRYALRTIKQTLQELPRGPLPMAVFLASIPIIKLRCSFRTLYRHPLSAMTNIPRNFYHNVFVIDMLMPPSIVPGAENTPLYYLNNAYRIILGIVYSTAAHYRKYGIFRTILVTVPGVITFLPVIITAFAFRYSIKSTAVFWLPLLWVLYQSWPGKQVLDRIEITVKQPWTKLVLFYSTFVIIVFGCKIGLIFEVWKFSLDFAGPLGILTTRLVAPFEMPLWQVTSAINAGLAWAFFFRAKRHVLAKRSFLLRDFFKLLI